MDIEWILLKSKIIIIKLLLLSFEVSIWEVFFKAARVVAKNGLSSNCDSS